MFDSIFRKFFFTSIEEAYFLSDLRGLPVSKKGDELTKYKNELITAPINTSFQNKLDIAMISITGALIGGGYAFAQWEYVEVGFVALSLFILLLILIWYHLRKKAVRIHGEKSNKSNVISLKLNDKGKSDFLYKKFGYKSIYSKQGNFLSLVLGIVIVLVFYWLVFYPEDGDSVLIFPLIVFGLLFFLFGLLIFISANLLRLLWRLKRKEYGLEYDAFLYTPPPPKKRKGKEKSAS